MIPCGVEERLVKRTESPAHAGAVVIKDATGGGITRTGLVI
jgi:hypothetical protein